MSHPHQQPRYRMAFIGWGQVGGPIADRLQRLGHHVTLAATDPQGDSILRLRARNPAIAVAPPADAVAAAGIVFLATPFRAAADVLPPLASQLAGRILVDCTNPVGPGLTHALAGGQSGSAVIQALVPGTAVVKAFTVYGFENLENNDYPGYGVRPAMPYCGADPAARRRVGELIDQLGWEPVDVGGLEQAVHLEHLALLWIRMVRVGGADPGIVWAALRRSAPAPGPHPAE